MAQTYYPFDSGSGANVTETQWSKMAQLWRDTGVIKAYNNELSVYADSTGMQAKVKTGAAWIKGHYYESDAEEVLAIGTANGTNPRIDRVIIRLDWTLNTIQLAVLQGVPAASPSAPALTQNSSRWEISLAQVRVNAGVSTITSGNITDERFPSPLITPTLLNGWAKNYQCHYWKDPDNTVHYNFSIMSGGTAANTTFMIFPAGYRPAENEMHVGFANGANFITSIATSGYFQNLVAVPSTSNVVLKGTFKAVQ